MLLTCWVTLGKFLGLSVLQFVHLQNGQNNIPFLMGSLGRLNKLIASPQHSAGMGYTLVSPACPGSRWGDDRLAACLFSKQGRALSLVAGWFTFWGGQPLWGAPEHSPLTGRLLQKAHIWAPRSFPRQSTDPGSGCLDGLGCIQFCGLPSPRGQQHSVR